MSDAVAEQASEQAQEQQDQSAQQDAQAPEQAQAEAPKEPHPLEPGGERFKEVWARAKAAESRMQEEREARIRAEAEAQVLRETRTTPKTETPDKVLSWTELKQLVADNKISEADALEYREKAVREQAVREAEQRITSKLTQQTQAQRLDAEIGKYKDAIPDVNVLGTDERKKFDAEFRFQVEFAGMDPKSLTTQLAALRAVYGPVEKAVQYAKARAKSTGAEPYQETSGGNQAMQHPTGKTWKDKLSPREKEHYERMISKGRYGKPSEAWDNVKKELEAYEKIKAR